MTIPDDQKPVQSEMFLKIPIGRVIRGVVSSLQCVLPLKSKRDGHLKKKGCFRSIKSHESQVGPELRSFCHKQTNKRPPSPID